MRERPQPMNCGAAAKSLYSWIPIMLHGPRVCESNRNRVVDNGEMNNTSCNSW